MSNSTLQVDCSQMLLRKMQTGQAVVAVMGLGFVGLPEAVAMAQSGLTVIGFDIDERRVASHRNGHSNNCITVDQLRSLQDSGRLYVTSDPSELREADCVIICVPSPLTEDRVADLSYLKAAATTVTTYMKNPKLVVIESTCPPGTTRQVLLPILKQGGARVGQDFFLAYAPERIDPGNKKHNIRNTPRLVSGVTEKCIKCAVMLYSGVIDDVRVLSSIEAAEMTKISENAFRFINISFVNELATLCDGLGINVWEVIDAAATKPFAFMAHQPGPGVGGACIPVVPFHLSSVAAEAGVPLDLIEAAGRVNDRMPKFVVDKLERLLAQQAKSLLDARILVLGITYKSDIPDMRVAPALKIMELLLQKQARVSYHDPLIKETSVLGKSLESTPLTPEVLSAADCVLLITPHSTVDYRLVVRTAPLIFDTRNYLSREGGDNIVCL